MNVLQPGPGVGGHCIAVDPWFIVSSSPQKARLIRTAREVNDGKPDWVIEKVRTAIGAYLMENPRKTASDLILSVYGLTFKPDIDDLRESPALRIATVLSQEHTGALLVVEPNITELPVGLGRAELVTMEEAHSRADIHIYLVAHSEFKVVTKQPQIAVEIVKIGR